MKLKTKPSKNDLARKIFELEAQLPHVAPFAYKCIDKAGTNHLMASGVILQLTTLGGREIISPVLIRDGLSTETIEAIKLDLRRSHKLTVLHTIPEN